MMIKFLAGTTSSDPARTFQTLSFWHLDIRLWRWLGYGFGPELHCHNDEDEERREC